MKSFVQTKKMLKNGDLPLFLRDIHEQFNLFKSSLEKRSILNIKESI